MEMFCFDHSGSNRNKLEVLITVSCFTKDNKGMFLVRSIQQSEIFYPMNHNDLDETEPLNLSESWFIVDEPTSVAHDSFSR
jgi:hypothetical protein